MKSIALKYKILAQTTTVLITAEVISVITLQIPLTPSEIPRGQPYCALAFHAKLTNNK